MGSATGIRKWTALGAGSIAGLLLLAMLIEPLAFVISPLARDIWMLSSAVTWGALVALAALALRTRTTTRRARWGYALSIAAASFVAAVIATTSIIETWTPAWLTDVGLGACWLALALLIVALALIVRFDV